MPDHTWRCPSCGKSNPAYTEVCRSCEQPSQFPKEVPPVTLTSAETHIPQKAENDFAFLFPEIIPSAVFVVGTPYWFYLLVSNGHNFIAIISIVALVPVVTLLLRLLKARRVVQADGVLMVVLALAWFVSHTLGKS